MKHKLESKKKKRRTPTVAHVLPLRDGIPYTYTHMDIHVRVCVCSVVSNFLQLHGL